MRIFEIVKFDDSAANEYLASLVLMEFWHFYLDAAKTYGDFEEPVDRYMSAYDLDAYQDLVQQMIDDVESLFASNPNLEADSPKTAEALEELRNWVGLWKI